MGRACSTNGEAEECIQESQKGKRPLGRPRRRWVDNIKMDLTRDRMGWYGLDRTGSGQGGTSGGLL
jgi:hypothetical protein